jgi:predicted nucleic acid-binding protein
MKKILLDTNTYAAFKQNREDVIETIQRVDYIGMNSIVFGELLAGFKGGKREAQNRKELDEFLDSPRVDQIAVNDDTAEYYAKIFSDLKSRGLPIPSNDLWIAASAMQHGLALYTLDVHFQKINGLLLK